MRSWCIAPREVAEPIPCAITADCSVRSGPCSNAREAEPASSRLFSRQYARRTRASACRAREERAAPALQGPAGALLCVRGKKREAAAAVKSCVCARVRASLSACARAHVRTCARVGGFASVGGDGR
eukprot:6196018-Pleurochrysis_carterae.AAC.1